MSDDGDHRNLIGDRYNRYTCATCAKSFRKPSLLKRHEVVHGKEKPFVCTQCEKGFSQNSSLRRHEMQTHAGQRKFKCRMCDMSFTQKVNMKSHEDNVHPQQPAEHHTQYHKCPQCSCLFRKANTLNRHIRKQHSTTDRLEFDPRTFEDSASVEDPIALAENVMKELKRLQSATERDEITADTSEEYVEDLAEIAKENTIIDMPTCSVVTVHDRLYPDGGDVQSLRVQRIQRADGFAYYVCEFCSKEFRKSFNYLRHRRSHTKQRPFICVLCKQAFYTVDKLKAHTKIHILDEHFGVFSRLHECNVCNEVFTSIRKLDSHMRTHPLENCTSFVCGQCHAAFKTKAVFSLHKHCDKDKELDMLRGLLPPPMELKRDSTSNEYRNDNQRCFQCSICDLNLKTQAHRREHERRHQMLKKHLCITCGRCYATQSSLNAHQKRHFGIKKYECVQCLKRFLSKSELRRHLQIHSTDRNFKCPYCDDTFKTKSNCRSHMVTHLKRLLRPHESRYSSDSSTSPTTHTVCHTKNNKKDTSLNISESQLLTRTSTESCCKEKVINPSDKNTCAVCWKTFRQTYDLRRHHLAKHTQKRPFRCEICEKGFALKSSLKEHYLTHAKTRRKYICQVCGKHYASQKVLTVHLRLHTGERPFRCCNCERTFRTSGHRIAHMKAIHKI